MNHNFSRRHFIRNASIGVAWAIAVPTILSSCAKGANDRILIGHIGVGSRGQDELLNYFLPFESSYQLGSCDPFQNRRENVAGHINDYYKKAGIKAPKCKAVLKFEDILERTDMNLIRFKSEVNVI